jgi:hypothetical protein
MVSISKSFFSTMTKPKLEICKLLNVKTNGREEVLCQEICLSLRRTSAVGGKTSNGAETYRTVNVYRSVECCNERSMKSQVAKLNVQRRMALLQKEEIENRKNILELEHAFKENEEIKSKSNAARVHSWKEEVIILMLVDSGCFVIRAKHNHIITVIETWI